MKRTILVLIICLMIIPSLGVIGVAEHKQYRGFVYNLEFNFDEHGDNLNDCTGNATALIGVIYTYNIYDIIDKDICILKNLEFKNIFLPPPWVPSPRLFINAALNRSIIFPIWVNCHIIE